MKKTLESKIEKWGQTEREYLRQEQNPIADSILNIYMTDINNRQLKKLEKITGIKYVHIYPAYGDERGLMIHVCK